MSDNSTYSTIGVIILIIVITIVVVLIWNNQEESQPPPLASYNEPCVSNTNDSNTIQLCSTGLTCIKTPITATTGVCKKNLGSICINTIECVPNLFCISGICSENQSGGLNQPPPCSVGYIDVDNICKAGSGISCSITSDCAVYSQQCVVTNVGNPNVKICTVPKGNGQPCIYNDDCSSLYCDPNTNVCTLNPTPSGGLSGSCLYYTPNNQYITCENTLYCQRDLANVTNTPSSTGICLPPVSSWPANNTNTICTSRTNSCIPPSTCYNGQCIFPLNFPLSCAVSTTSTTGSSSGGCLKGFSCVNSTTCVPSSGYPGAGTNWNLVEWIRSENEQMGYWNSLPVNLPEPGTRPSFTTFTDINGSSIVIYSPDVSLNSYNISSNVVTIKPYYILQNGILSDLIIKYVNSDSVLQLYIDIPYIIKFIPSNTSMKIIVLTNHFIYNPSNPSLTEKSWYLMTATLNGNTLTVVRPSFNSAIITSKVVYPAIPTNFNLDFRDLGRMMYNLGDSWYIRQCIANGITDNYPINLDAENVDTLLNPILQPIFDLQFLTNTDEIQLITQLVINKGTNIELYNMNINFGTPDINKMSVTTYPDEFEILYTRTFNGVTSLNLVEGSNSVVMPVDINSKTIPNISVTLVNQLPKLYILTTTVT